MVVLTERSEELSKQNLAFFQEPEQGFTKEELMQFFAITEKLKKHLE